VTDPAPGDLLELSTSVELDRLVTVLWIDASLASAVAMPTVRCVCRDGRISTCTHRAADPETRLLRGERP